VRAGRYSWHSRNQRCCGRGGHGHPTNLWDLITGKVKGGLSGPVGIAREMANAAQQGASRFLEIVLLIAVAWPCSICCPFLDSTEAGRFSWRLAPSVDATSNPILEAKIHMVGIMLLMGLLVVVTFSDLKPLVLKLFG